jgi:hypothetical protein
VDLPSKEKGERSRSKTGRNRSKKERIDCVVVFLLFYRSRHHHWCRKEKEKKPISTALFPGCFRGGA